MNTSLITFHTEDINFSLDNSDFRKNWIISTINKEQMEVGCLTYVFCSDPYLHKMNVEYLNHDTFTDIITFNYCENTIISGDIFISVDRVRENALKYDVLFEDELDRVIVHGVLHLIGYNDKSKEEQAEMRGKEEFYLNLRPECST